MLHCVTHHDIFIFFSPYQLDILDLFWGVGVGKAENVFNPVYFSLFGDKKNVIVMCDKIQYIGTPLNFYQHMVSRVLVDAVR